MSSSIYGNGIKPSGTAADWSVIILQLVGGLCLPSFLFIAYMIQYVIRVKQTVKPTEPNIVIDD
jgi:hypothetical protein